MYMKKLYSDLEYLAPEVEVINVAVEQGFQGSMESPVEKPEQDW